MSGGGGGKKGGGKVKIPFYHISMHIGLCHSTGEADLVSIYAGDKLVDDVEMVWDGGRRINKEKMFGGPLKEGGLKGAIWYYSGYGAQVMHGPHAYRLGRTSATCPGFRGIASVWLTGFHSSTTHPDWRMDSPHGFFVATSNPYIKPFKFRMRRKPRAAALNDATSMIPIQNRLDGKAMTTANPAHVLYEIYTNTAWGEGRSSATINTASFDAAATTLFNENFGISFAWMRQTTIEKVVQEIIDHIQASVYDDPATGQLTIKLLRDDYAVGSLKELNPSNAKLTHFRRKLWGEVSSEVVVTWTNPEDEREMTVTAHNLSAAVAQGGNPVSTSRNFYMVRSPTLAARLAERELKMLSYPLAAFDAEVFREFSSTVPGDVVRVNWPDKDIVNMPMRVMEVVPGSSSSDKITLKLQEDIFALPTTNYLQPVTTKWAETPSNQPRVPVSEGGGTVVVPDPPSFTAHTMPAYITAKALGHRSVADIPYPAAVGGFLARKWSAADFEYHVIGPTTLPDGSTKDRVLTENYYPGWGLAAGSIPQEAFSQIPITQLRVGAIPQRGDLVVFNTIDAVGEIGLVENFWMANFTLVVRRGVLDTVPRPWSASTPIYFFNPLQDNISDPTERAVGESTVYTIEPHRTMVRRTSVLPRQILSTALNDRAYRPLRPANVKVNGTGFGTATSPAGQPINVTWANRNRITESEQIISWDGGSSSPEVGQTTFLNLYESPGGAKFKEYDGLTGTSFSIPYADLGGRTSFYVGAMSRRDGMVSYSQHRIAVNIV